MDLKTSTLTYLQTLSRTLHPCALKDQIDQLLATLPHVVLNSAGKLRDSLGFSLDAAPIGAQPNALVSHSTFPQRLRKHQGDDLLGKSQLAALIGSTDQKNQDAQTSQEGQIDTSKPKPTHQYAQLAYSNFHPHPQLSPIQKIYVAPLNKVSYWMVAPFCTLTNTRKSIMSDIELKLPATSCNSFEILQEIQARKDQIDAGFYKAGVKHSLTAFSGFLDALVLLDVISEATAEQQLSEAIVVAEQRLLYIKSIK